MEVEKIGEGEPEYAVVGGIHGDEPCGKHAIEKFLDSDYKVEKSVKLVIANEKALEKDERFTDTDLNRSFPGDPNSSLHEERLAAKLMNELKGLKVLDLHSTRSSSEVFAAQSKLDKKRLELVKSTGAQKVSFHAKDQINCLEEYLIATGIECGYQGSKQAKRQAYQVLINFLAAQGVIKEEFEVSDPEILKIYETVEKPDYKFLAENFKPVKKGQTYAKTDKKEIQASEKFYPVLMSTNGYDHILGHKAEKATADDL